MCLDHIDVVRRSAAARDNQIAFLRYLDRVSACESVARFSVRRLPITAVQIRDAAVVVRDSTNGKNWRRKPYAFDERLVHGIAIENPRVDALTPSLSIAVESKLVG